MRSPAPRGAVAAAVIGGVVCCDAATKQLVLTHIEVSERVEVLGPLSIVSWRNRGGAFSIADGTSVFPWVVSVLVVALIVWFLRALHRNDERLKGPGLVAVSLMIGGAVANQVDRWLRAPRWNRGAVIDFIDVGFWPAFNLADAALVCGAIGLIALALFERPTGDSS